jgi:hypothetical protein
VCGKKPLILKSPLLQIDFIQIKKQKKIQDQSFTADFAKGNKSEDF